jgi:hypothetical protein
VALRAIGAIFEPGDVIEIRALNVDRSGASGSTYSGYFTFDSSDQISQAVTFLDGHAEGIYVVLNRFNPALLARANNRLQPKPKHTTSDADITERHWLYIDADPVRPAGISSTDEEHEGALNRANEIREFLSEQGWPAPLYADSGNGAHLLYRLPALELARAGDLVKRCLKALAARFSDESVKVDESTSNAARICKLYGTLTCKGDATPDRPHRRSRLLEYPERLEAVSIGALEALASEVATGSPAPKGKCNQRSSIDDWILAAGLDVVKGPESYSGGRKWTLRTCAFNPEHERPVIIEMPNGARVYRCLHNSCKENDWRAFRRRVAPDDPDTSSEGSSPDNSAVRDRDGAITSISQIPSVWTLESHCEWCVPDMIARGSVTLISAESGTGKTWLGYFLAGRVAHGRDALGRAVRRSRVLYLDGENPLYMVKQRLFDLGIAETPDLTIWGGWNTWPPPGPESPVVVKFVREHMPLIVYDSLIEFHPGSEQSSTETRAFMRRFRALANLGATVVILHHTGKAPTSKEYRGSSDIKAAVDTAYLLERVDENTPEIRKLLLKCFKGRLALAQNFSMEFRRGLGFVPAESSKTVSEIIEDLLREHPGFNQSQIIKLCVARGCSKSQVQKALKNGKWDTGKGPKNATLYVLPKPEERSEEPES